MSQSPLEAPAGESAAEPEDYAAGWSALSKSLRRGFSWSGNERDCAYLNTGVREGASLPGFASFAGLAGLDLKQDSRGAVAVDWDHDGDLDLWVRSRSEPRLRWMRNDLVNFPSLGLRPVGTGTNRDGVGARVEVHLEGAPWPSLVRTRRAGEGFLSQGGPWLHFGIGRATVTGCTVEWPGGEREVFEGLDGTGRFVLVEGAGVATPEDRYLAEHGSAPERGEPTDVSGEVAQETSETASRIPANDSGSPVDPGGPAGVVLRDPRPVPSLALETKDGRAARFLGVQAEGHRGTGSPILVLLWAQWCAPCIAELKGLAASRAALEGAGIQVLALSVDRPEDRATARSRLTQMEWPFSSGFATPSASDVLDVLAGSVVDSEERLALPTSFLIDGEGRLLAIYRGSVSGERVVADLARIGAAGPLAAATPFPGIWASEPPTADVGALAARFERRGLAEPARELRLSQVEVRTLSAAEFELTRARARLTQGDLEGAATAFRAATRSDPESFDAHSGLALTLHRMGQVAQAVPVYEWALAIDPSRALTRFNLALALATRGDLEGAASHAQRLAEDGSPLAQELEARLAEIREMSERK